MAGLLGRRCCLGLRGCSLPSLFHRTSLSLRMLTTVHEGLATIKAPEDDRVPFDREHSIIRDLKVLATSAFSKDYCRWKTTAENKLTEPLRLLDAFAGTGASSVRLVREVSRPIEAVLCDNSQAAVDCAKENVERNEIEATVELDDCRRFLVLQCRNENYFDVVDLDPPDHPLNYVSGTFHAVNKGGLLLVTIRRGVELPDRFPGLRIEGDGEMQEDEFHLRSTIGHIARMAFIVNRIVEPLLCTSTPSGLFLALRLSKKVMSSVNPQHSVPYVHFCSNCHQVQTQKLAIPARPQNLCHEPRVTVCPNCSKPLMLVGRAWSGPFVDKDFSDRIQTILSEPDGPSKYISLT